MFEHDSVTRRTVLKGVGAAAGATVVPAVGAAVESGWTAVDSPTGNTLHDVARTSTGAYAVGGGGVGLRRTATGWEKVFDGGPTGNGNNLYGADVTDDGTRLWFVGASGAIGEYDVESGVLTDHSAPNDVTNNFNDVSVEGEAGDANVYVAGDSGKIYFSFENGETGTWANSTPGSGSAINAVDFFGPRSGHAVDGNKSTFVTDDGGTYDKIGIAGANVNLYGIDSDSDEDIYIAGGGGTVFEYVDGQWETTSTNDTQLHDIEVAGNSGLTVGGGGDVYEYDGTDWTPVATPVGDNLKGVIQGSVDIAVGAGGTIIER
jgi:hypothetical protein